MLYWALVFFVVAIIAAVFGFGGIGIPEHDQLAHNQHSVVP